MTWPAAFCTGVGVGLASYGGLWLTVRRMVRRPGGRGLLGLSWLVRFLLVALVFYALSREGTAMLLLGIGGLLLARWYLLVRLGGLGHGS
jgi:F1F0 ATPase subunit 2